MLTWWYRSDLQGSLVYFWEFLWVTEGIHSILILTWPMAKLFGITYLVGKIKFKLLFQDPLAKWELDMPFESTFNQPWSPRITSTDHQAFNIASVPCAISHVEAELRLCGHCGVSNTGLRWSWSHHWCCLNCLLGWSTAQKKSQPFLMGTNVILLAKRS